MVQNTEKYTVITGASSGIGYETVGFVDRETFSFHLYEPQFQYAGSSCHNQKSVVSHGHLELPAPIPESQSCLHYCSIFSPPVQLDFTIYCTEMRVLLKRCTISMNKRCDL